MTLAWLFPGQGSQEVGMGRDLSLQSEAARHVYERADQALGRPISALCFEGPLEELTRTYNAQPALVTTSFALLEAMRERYPNLPMPAFAAGHSLGEYSALVSTGVLSLEDAVRLVELRGRAMQEAVPEGQGAMAAILGGDANAVEALCDAAREGDVLAAANFNAPGQVVISGTKAAVTRATELAAERKLKGILLKVSAPFHCSLMAPAARRVDLALAELSFGAFSFPIVANVTADPNLNVSSVRDLLVRQIDGPVLWAQTISSMAEAGVTQAIEIGPGKVLAGLAKRIDKRISVFTVSDLAGIEALGGVLGL